MLAQQPTILAEPSLGWDDLVAGYRLRGLELSFGADASPAGP
ncbi:hypothetical protein [Brachybacterium sacelli]|uniref:Uncharacterized protein n=1 Tax=Brachybacterium sacelli TaxID=173364 RepID=A0ABS4X4X5_9MICO|nr:hypothetical protein [Brachybacterium sacelli]